MHTRDGFRPQRAAIAASNNRGRFLPYFPPITEKYFWQGKDFLQCIHYMHLICTLNICYNYAVSKDKECL